MYAMKLSPGGHFWLVIDPLLSHVRVSMLSAKDYQHPGLYDPEAKIIKVTSHINFKDVVHGIGIFSCVTTIKALLGIKKRIIITPFQLYEYLR